MVLTEIRSDGRPYTNVPIEDRFLDPDSDEVAYLDYLAAPDLEEIGERLIGECTEFQHLRELRVVYLWKREGGQSAGKLTLGKCVKAGGLVKHFSQSVWIIWLAADHADLLGLTERQVEAAIYHELSHASEEEKADGTLKPVLIGHDWQGFGREVGRYGAWLPDLQLCRRTWRQLELPEGEQVAAAGG